MSPCARVSDAMSLKPHDIRRPFSNFDFIDREFPELSPLRRILSQVRQLGGQTMVVEELSINTADDLREEQEDLQRYYSNLPTSVVHRISFFDKLFSTKGDLQAAVDDDFLGYAIIKRDEVPLAGSQTRIYESVIRASRHDNNYIRGEQEWACSIDHIPLTVKGYLYAQQNGITNVCAHAAARTAAARFHQAGDMTYRQMNELPGISVDHINKKFGRHAGGGLSQHQIVEILEEAGARCFLFD